MKHAAAAAFLLLATAAHAQPAPASREQAQQILADAIGRVSYELHQSRPPARAYYRADASEPCLTRYRRETPAHSRARPWQALEGGEVVWIPLGNSPAKTDRVQLDWSAMTAAAPHPRDPEIVILTERRFVGVGLPANPPTAPLHLTVPADSRARVLAAARYLIGACRRPAQPTSNPFIFVTSTGTQHRTPMGGSFEVTRQWIVTPDGDRTGRYGSALILLGGTGQRYRVTWRSPVPIGVVVAADEFPNKAQVELAFANGPDPVPSGSVEISFTRHGQAVLGLTQPRAANAIGARFGSDFRPYTVTVTRLD